MQTHSKIIYCALLSSALLASPAIAENVAVFTHTPAQHKWDEKATGPQGMTLHTDPSYGVATKRVRIPANTDLPPHGHAGGYRLVTVIEGTLLLGFGNTFDEKALQELPAGSVFSEPAGHKHFARTRGEAVVLQLTEIHPPVK